MKPETKNIIDSIEAVRAKVKSMMENETDTLEKSKLIRIGQLLHRAQHIADLREGENENGRKS